jgi:hypothetical protein
MSKINLVGKVDIHSLQGFLSEELKHSLRKYLEFFPILKELAESRLVIAVNVSVTSVPNDDLVLERECDPSDSHFGAEIKELLTLCDSVSLNPGDENRSGQEREVEVSGFIDIDEGVLSRSIYDLNLSVRARKCMTRLGVSTLGDLVKKTAEDLLGCKDFGVVSLNEVRAKLQDLGLKLRGD